MKIALPTRDGMVDQHFGHCEAFCIMEINNEKKIMGTETVTPPPGCGCKSNIISTLVEKGVTIMLAGNMGGGAVQMLQHNGITVYRGCVGAVDVVVADFLAGTIEDTGIGCTSHGDCAH